MSDTTYTLVLLRHGESTWNALNQFTGWVDVDLSEKGLAEAVRGGELLKESGLLPDVVHTSLLRRAIKTSQIALDTCDRHWIPVVRNWRLNERSYGGLQGLNKAETAAKHGEEQVRARCRGRAPARSEVRDAEILRRTRLASCNLAGMRHKACLLCASALYPSISGFACFRCSGERGLVPSL